MVAVFREQYGRDPKVEAIHAGVECGLFAGKLPGLDCVSFGPDLTEIHTCRERMHIASVQRVWRYTLEVLRQPLEEHRIVISRVSGNYVFPASFLMVAAMNPCPCGFYPDLSRCTCAPGDISRYLSRVSQPFLDRMDLCVQVEALSYEDLHGEERCESSAKMREKATAAAEIQAARYRQESIHFNSELKAGQIEKYCILEKAAEELLEDAFRRLRLSARSYHGIIRTARTIADLDGAVKIGVPHISEAICFRSADKSIWRI